jgi:hypothetical protein
MNLNCNCERGKLQAILMGSRDYNFLPLIICGRERSAQ